MKEIKSNGLEDIITQAIDDMKAEQENKFSLDKINLAELEHRTGVSRSKQRRLKAMVLCSNPMRWRDAWPDRRS